MINNEVSDTAQKAFKFYLTKYLFAVDPNTVPADFSEKVHNAYANTLNGDSLSGNKKVSDAEAKIKMHIKTASSAATVLSNTRSDTVDANTFYSSALQDIFYAYLDSLYGSSLGGEDHSIFTTLTRRHEANFMQDMRNLDVLDPDEITRVTEYGPQIIKFVEQIERRKFAYSTPDGSVYFDVEAYDKAGQAYPKLEPWNKNNKPLQEEGEGSLQKATGKKSRVDFALWKASNPGEPSWSSAWGMGRPGWHIECSAMASDKLGRQLDIHSGGIDLAFPHHDNELAQSEAYWHEEGTHSQWVNYFLHMGHLSIAGAKMSKSLKNFTTIRYALENRLWTSRSLRIVFLLGSWRDGIEITDDLVKAGQSWEEKVDNFFINARDLVSRNHLSSKSDTTFSKVFEDSQKAVRAALLDSFNTSSTMSTISELITQYNNMDKVALNPKDVNSVALWITSLVNIFGLNGTASSDPQEIGWAGIEIPTQAKPYVEPLSQMRDGLRQAARSSQSTDTQHLSSIVHPQNLQSIADASDPGKPFADVLATFQAAVTPLIEEPDKNAKAILSLCDRLRDTDLFDLGVYLEDREDQPALIRPVSKEMIQLRQEGAERARVKQFEKEKREKEERQKAEQKAEQAKISHTEMFKTGEFSEWDKDGLPLKDPGGEALPKSKSKKLKKDWEKQKKLHEEWLASQ